MGAAWLFGRASARHRWSGVVLVTILVTLVGAVVGAAAAGARRTATSVERFRDETLAADVTVFIPAVDPATIARLRRIDGVEALGVGRQLTATIDGGFSSAVGGPINGAFGTEVDRPRVLEGRSARQDRIHEVAVPEPLARQFGYEPGDRIVLRAYTPEQVAAVLEGGDVTDPEGPEVTLRVVGVTRAPNDLSLEGGTGGVLFVTQAFTERFGDEIGSFSGSVLRVRTTDDEASRRFVRRARALVASQGQPGEFQVQPAAEVSGAVQQSIDVVVVGLVVFAIVAALTGIVVIAVTVRRFVDGSGRDVGSLRALGMSRRSCVAGMVLPLLPAGAAGAFLGVLGGWLASPVFPLGLARQAEPDPGLWWDGPLLLGLAAIVLGAVVVIATVSAWFVLRAATGARRVRRRPSRAVRAASGTAIAAPVTVGVTMAFEREHRRGTVAARPAITGAVVAVAGIVAVLVVVGSLHRLLGDPPAWGYNWDAHLVVEDPDRADPLANCSPTRAAVVHDPALATVADVCSGTLEVNGYSTTGVGLTDLSGHVAPTVLAGRAASRPGEVALGTRTMEVLGVALGDRVRIAGPGGQRTARVTGRVVLPVLERAEGDAGDLQAVADGAMFTGAGLQPLLDDDLTSAMLLVRWQPGADRAAAKARFAADPAGVQPPYGPVRPLEVSRIDQLRVLPWLLGAFLGVIGVLGIGYGVVTAVRARDRDLAVLRAIGMRRRQVLSTVLVQASLYAAFGVVLGVPLGLLVGRLGWERIAGSAGLAGAMAVPTGWIVVVAGITVLIANAVALAPARRAVGHRPAAALREE